MIFGVAPLDPATLVAVPIVRGWKCDRRRGAGAPRDGHGADTQRLEASGEWLISLTDFIVSGEAAKTSQGSRTGMGDADHSHRRIAIASACDAKRHVRLQDA